MTLSLLDGSVPALEKAIPSLSVGELELLLDAEKNGKTRIGAVKVLEAAIAAYTEIAEEDAAPAPGNIIENIIPGTTLHLGDGRRLAFGESAEVLPAIAAQLRASGQAR